MFDGDAEGDPGSAFGSFLQEAGFFPAMFGQEPDPMLPGRPKGDLGPKYVVTYLVPGPDVQPGRVRQELYPYAKQGPVTYTLPGQPFFGGERTHGGWYAASPALTSSLVALGLPRTRRPRRVAAHASPPAHGQR